MNCKEILLPMKSIAFLAISTMVSIVNARAQPAPPVGGSWVTLRHGINFDWPSLPGLFPATGPLRKDDVLALMNELDAGAWGSDITGIWEFRFAPLSPGKAYLLVTESCRLECGSVEAVSCQENRCFSDAVTSVVDLETDLVDVDGDGALEVIGKECIEDCSGIPRLPTFVYSVYKFIDGKGFVDYSAEAADYYREHLLPKIETAQSTIESRVAAMNVADEKHREIAGELGIPFPPPGQIERYKAASQYAYDDYRRRVLGEKYAGLDNAIRWLESDDTRDLALQALARIPDLRADAKLLEAARSKNAQLAEQAKGFLELRRELRSRGLLK